MNQIISNVIAAECFGYSQPEASLTSLERLSFDRAADMMFEFFLKDGDSVMEISNAIGNKIYRPFDGKPGEKCRLSRPRVQVWVRLNRSSQQPS